VVVGFRALLSCTGLGSPLAFLCLFVLSLVFMSEVMVLRELDPRLPQPTLDHSSPFSSSSSSSTLSSSLSPLSPLPPAASSSLTSSSSSSLAAASHLSSSSSSSLPARGQGQKNDLPHSRHLPEDKIFTNLPLEPHHRSAVSGLLYGRALALAQHAMAQVRQYCSIVFGGKCRPVSTVVQGSKRTLLCCHLQ